MLTFFHPGEQKSTSFYNHFSSMKIFFLITKSEAGGAQTHVAQLTKFFVSRGDKVEIMSAPGGWLEHEAHRLGAQFFSNPFLSNSTNPMRLLKAASVLSNAISKFQPDLVACHSTMTGLLGRLTIRNRIQTVFTAHGWGFTQGAPLLRRILLPILERMAARFCSKIICVSQNDLALALNYRIAPQNKLVQIYNGIEIPKPQRSNHQRSTTNLFFVGRLAPPKDPSMLIRAVSELPKDLQERVIVTIIGDGPQMTALQDLVHETHLDSRVNFSGALTREQVLERLQTEADLFVLLSHFEGFPYSILEAMSCSLPIIASDVGGIKEAVTPDVGILIEHDDLETLVHALAQLIENPDERRQMGQRARAKSQNEFSIEQMCDKTLTVYQSLI